MTALTTSEKENPMGSYHQSGTFFKNVPEPAMQFPVVGRKLIV